MTTRPKLLFLCHTLPYPLDGGVWIRTYHVMRLLAQSFDITALCFERQGASGVRDDHNIKGAVSELSRFGTVESFPVPQNGRRNRFLWDHLRSVATRRVYTRFVYDSLEFKSHLRDVVDKNAFQVAHIDSLDLASYISSLGDVPVVCVHHNVESSLLQRRARFVGGAVAKSYYALQSRWMQDIERMWVPAVALNVMVSGEDQAEMTRIAPGGRYLVVPNGVDVDEFQPRFGESHGVAYVGGTNWFPNLDALNFFGEEILPHLRAQNFNQPIRWLGSATKEQIMDFQSRFGIELTGYLEDVRPRMQAAFCHIVPLRAGGGTRLKILSSWAMGKPVVSTSIGCEGLDARDGDNILIRDNPIDFAKAIIDLGRDVALQTRLGQSARRTAEDVYSWEVIGEEMKRRYLGLIKGKNDTPPRNS